MLLRSEEQDLEGEGREGSTQVEGEPGQRLLGDREDWTGAHSTGRRAGSSSSWRGEQQPRRAGPHKPCSLGGCGSRSKEDLRSLKGSAPWEGRELGG